MGPQDSKTSLHMHNSGWHNFSGNNRCNHCCYHGYPRDYGNYSCCNHWNHNYWDHWNHNYWDHYYWYHWNHYYWYHYYWDHWNHNYWDHNHRSSNNNNNSCRNNFSCCRPQELNFPMIKITKTLAL